MNSSSASNTISSPAAETQRVLLFVVTWSPIATALGVALICLFLYFFYVTELSFVALFSKYLIGPGLELKILS